MDYFWFYLIKVVCKLTKSYEPLRWFYGKKGASVGKGCLLCSPLASREPYLIEIGDYTTISKSVTFVTHDNSIKLVISDKTDLFGKIKIGSHCFIGQCAVLMYGIEIADNVIVAAGSVVTKSVKESNVVVGGNPARVIGAWDGLRAKSQDKAITRSELRHRLNNDDSFLVQR